MKSTAIVCAIAASALGFSSLSFAQGYGDRDGRDDNRRGYSQRGERGDHWDGRHDRHERRDRNDGQRGDYRQHQYQPQHSYQQRSYNYQHQWSGHAHRYQRGEHLPYQFRQRQYYVNDWRSHRGLYAPPSGYHWVQADGGDYLLVALATGLIANLLINQ